MGRHGRGGVHARFSLPVGADGGGARGAPQGARGRAGAGVACGGQGRVRRRARQRRHARHLAPLQRGRETSANILGALLQACPTSRTSATGRGGRSSTTGRATCAPRSAHPSALGPALSAGPAPACLGMEKRGSAWPLPPPLRVWERTASLPHPTVCRTLAQGNASWRGGFFQPLGCSKCEKIYCPRCIGNIQAKPERTREDPRGPERTRED